MWDAQSPPVVFETPRSHVVQAVLLFLGGLVMAGVLFMLFVLVGLAKPKPGTKDTFNPAPVFVGLCATALFAGAIARVKGSQRVSLTRRGVTVEGAMSTTSFDWTSLRHAKTGKSQGLYGMGGDSLDLFDTSGRRVARLNSAVSRFAELKRHVEAAIGVHHPTPPEANWLRRAERAAGRSSRTLLCVLALPLGLAFLIGGCFGAHNWWKNSQLSSADGAVVEAKVERLFKKSVTPYVEYSFLDPSGSTQRREEMMDERAWTAAWLQPTVRVEYLRSDPAWNRLFAGSGESRDDLFMMVLPLGMGVVVLGSVGILLSGWDIASENGQTLLLRRGEVVRTWGKPKPAPPAMPAANSDEPLVLDGDDEVDDAASPASTRTVIDDLPESIQLPPRRLPGLTLLAAAITSLGVGFTLFRGLGLIAISALASGAIQLEGVGYERQSDYAVDFALQGVGVVAGVLALSAGIALFVRQASTTVRWFAMIAMLAVLIAVGFAFYTTISMMLELPDIPGEQGLAVRLGAVLSLLVNIVLAGATLAMLFTLIRFRNAGSRVA